MRLPETIAQSYRGLVSTGVVPVAHNYIKVLWGELIWLILTSSKQHHALYAVAAPLYRSLWKLTVLRTRFAVMHMVEIGSIESLPAVIKFI